MMKEMLNINKYQGQIRKNQNDNISSGAKPNKKNTSIMKNSSSSELLNKYYSAINDNSKLAAYNSNTVDINQIDELDYLLDEEIKV